MNAPEYESLDAFVEYLRDDEREQFTHEDLQALNYRLRIPTRVIRIALVGMGFKLRERVFEKRVRGCRTSSHDRWFGPGADRTYGGSGFDNRPFEKTHLGYPTKK